MVFRVVGKHFEQFNFDKSVRPHKLNYHNDTEQMYSYNRFDMANRPSKRKPPGACTWKIALKYKVNKTKTANLH